MWNDEMNTNLIVFKIIQKIIRSAYTYVNKYKIYLFAMKMLYQPRIASLFAIYMPQ